MTTAANHSSLKHDGCSLAGQPTAVVAQHRSHHDDDRTWVVKKNKLQTQTDTCCLLFVLHLYQHVQRPQRTAATDQHISTKRSATGVRLIQHGLCCSMRTPKFVHNMCCPTERGVSPSTRTSRLINAGEDGGHIHGEEGAQYRRREACSAECQGVGGEGRKP